MRTSASTSREMQSTRRALSYLLAGVLLALSPSFSCGGDDGQSGSEATLGSGGNPNQDRDVCPCGLGGLIMRASVLTRSEGEVLLRIEEVLHGATPLQPGDQVLGEWNGDLPCQVGKIDIGIGAEAFVQFFPEEREPAGCGGCVELDWSRGTARLTPWSESLLLAQTAQGSLSLAPSEVDELWTEDRQECLDRHGDASYLPGALDLP